MVRAPNCAGRLGFAMVGGLALSQLLTLFSTPVVYLYLERIHQWYAQRRQRREPKDDGLVAQP